MDGVLGAVLGAVHVGLDGLRDVLLEALLEVDVVLLTLLEVDAVLLALLAVDVIQLTLLSCVVFVLALQLSDELWFEPSGKEESVDRTRWSRAYDARRCVSVHRDLTGYALPIRRTFFMAFRPFDTIPIPNTRLDL